MQGLLRRHGKVFCQRRGEPKRKAPVENVKEAVESGATVFTEEAAVYHEMRATMTTRL